MSEALRGAHKGRKSSYLPISGRDIGAVSIQPPKSGHAGGSVNDTGGFISHISYNFNYFPLCLILLISHQIHTCKLAHMNYCLG